MITAEYLLSNNINYLNIINNTAYNNKIINYLACKLYKKQISPSYFIGGLQTLPYPVIGSRITIKAKSSIRGYVKNSSSIKAYVTKKTKYVKLYNLHTGSIHFYENRLKIVNPEAVFYDKAGYLQFVDINNLVINWI